jgi:hypothetical protein
MIMGIGASIFLLAVGAIITFAFNITVGWLDLDVVGWVLMAAGALGLTLTLAALTRRRRTVVTSGPNVEQQHSVDYRPTSYENHSTSYEDRPL